MFSLYALVVVSFVVFYCSSQIGLNNFQRVLLALTSVGLFIFLYAVGFIGLTATMGAKWFLTTSVIAYTFSCFATGFVVQRVVCKGYVTTLLLIALQLLTLNIYVLNYDIGLTFIAGYSCLSIAITTVGAYIAHHRLQNVDFYHVYRGFVGTCIGAILLMILFGFCYAITKQFVGNLTFNSPFIFASCLAISYFVGLLVALNWATSLTKYQKNYLVLNSFVYGGFTLITLRYLLGTTILNLVLILLASVLAFYISYKKTQQRHVPGGMVGGKMAR